MKTNCLILSTLLSVGMMSKAQEPKVKLPEPSRRVAYKDYAQSDKGFWCSVEVNGGSSLIFNHANVQRVGAFFTTGYRFCEFFRVGAGLGASYYVNGNKNVRGDKNAMVMPLFVNVRGNAISHESREAVPYWSMDIGTMLGDGIFLSPTLGVRIGQARNALLLGLRYTLAEIDACPNYSTTVNFFSFNIGYEF